MDHSHDEFGQLEVVIDARELGGTEAQINFDGRLKLRFPEQAIAILRTGTAAGICQFMLPPSPTKAFVCALPGQRVDAEMLEVRKLDVEMLRADLAGKITPEMLSHVVNVAVDPPATDSAKSHVGRSMPFSTFVTEYLHRNGPLWKPDQHARRVDQCNAFLELVGDVRLAKRSTAR